MASRTPEELAPTRVIVEVRALPERNEIGLEVYQTGVHRFEKHQVLEFLQGAVRLLQDEISQPADRPAPAEPDRGELM